MSDAGLRQLERLVKQGDPDALRTWNSPEFISRYGVDFVPTWQEFHKASGNLRLELYDLPGGYQFLVEYVGHRVGWLDLYKIGERSGTGHYVRNIAMGFRIESLRETMLVNARLLGN